MGGGGCADRLKRSPLDLPQWGSIDIEFQPSSHILIWLKIGGWLACIEGKWAYLLTEIPFGAVRQELGTRILVRLLSSCRIWLAQPGEGLTPVWSAVTIPCRRRAIMIR